MATPLEHPLLASLEDRERRQVLSRMRRHDYPRDALVVSQGEPSDSLHLVVAGRLGVRVSTAQGQDATINLLGRGDYFGELSLLEAEPGRRTATIVALEPSVTLSLAAADFRTFRARHRAADQLLLTLLARRVRELSEQVLQATYEGLEQRALRRLVQLAGMYGAGRPAGPVVVPLTQQSFAELVGGTRPTINQLLQALAAEGLVELRRGRIVVLDVAALRRRL